MVNTAESIPEVKVVRLCQRSVKLPTKATCGSACYDLYSANRFEVQQGGCTKVGTGLSFEIPPGWFMEIRPRSGLSKEGVVLLNSPATIDSDYRGEVCLLLTKLFDPAYVINEGDRIAQIRLVKEESVTWKEATDLSSTERGSGGFGSTGK